MCVHEKILALQTESTFSDTFKQHFCLAQNNLENIFGKNTELSAV